MRVAPGARDPGAPAPYNVCVIAPLLSRPPGLVHGFLPPGEAAPVPLWRPKQVHGAVILDVRDPGAPQEPADGAVSTRPGVAAAVVTADCVPLLLAAEDGAAVAAVHAGWRGVAAGVVEEGVRRLAAAAPGRALVAAIGPAAGGCCYEVGPEVLEAVRPADAWVTPTHDGHARLDLRGVVRDRLLSLGLAERNIERVGPCTICSPPWPSYRREGPRAGRILSFIAPFSGE